MADFYKASEARDQAVVRRPVIDEVQLIQSGISDAIESGSFTASIGPSSSVSTGLSNSTVAFNAWADPANHTADADNVARFQMNQVISYFTKLGYAVSRVQYQNSTTFDWVITW